MKIVSFDYNAHPILGNLRLDLTNPATGEPYSNIMLAGENGIGKSTVLKTLNSFLCIGPMSPFKEIVYKAQTERRSRLNLLKIIISFTIIREPIRLISLKKSHIVLILGKRNY